MTVRVTKGRFSVIETDEVYDFLFNPNQFVDQRVVGFPDQSVPGMSHPVVQYGAGGARTITFTLYLDGDRGYLGLTSARREENQARRPRLLDPWESAAERSRTRRQGISKSIQAEIDFLQSLTYPIRSEGIGLADVHPPTVLFSLGEQYLGMECVVPSVTVTTTYWTPRMEPIRAEVGITLKQKVARSVERRVVYDVGSVRR